VASCLHELDIESDGHLVTNQCGDTLFAGIRARYRLEGEYCVRVASRRTLTF
jgi:hypothetical protein